MAETTGEIGNETTQSRSGRRRSRRAAAGLAAALTISSAGLAAGSPAEARGRTVTVTTDAATGPGSLDAAFDLASTDRRVGRIVVERSLSNSTIVLDETLVFEGQQTLSVDGNGVTIDAGNVATAVQFRSAGYAGLKEMTIEFAQETAVDIDVVGSKKLARFWLTDVDITGSQNGVILDDERGARGMWFSVRNLSVDASSVGVQMTTEGDGHARFWAGTSDIDAGDVALSIVESGTGSVGVDVVKSTLAADSVGALVLSERDRGDLRANVSGSELIGPEVAELRESGFGNARIMVSRSTLEGLGGGFSVSEADAGTVFARVRAVDATVAGPQLFDGSAVTFTESGAGNLNVTVAQLDVEGMDNGVKASESDAGRGTVRVTRSDFSTLPSAFEVAVDRFIERNNKLPVE